MGQITATNWVMWKVDLYDYPIGRENTSWNYAKHMTSITIDMFSGSTKFLRFLYVDTWSKFGEALVVLNGKYIHDFIYWANFLDFKKGAYVVRAILGNKANFITVRTPCEISRTSRDVLQDVARRLVRDVRSVLLRDVSCFFFARHLALCRKCFVAKGLTRIFFDMDIETK